MVSTRKGNATKHVAQPLLDGKRKHRTKAEIKADKQQLEEERKKAEEVRQAGNERIAGILDKQALDLVRAKVAATPRPRPRPRPQLAKPTSGGPGQPSTQQDQTKDNDTPDGPKGVSVSVTATTDAREEELRPRKEPRKTMHRDAVHALRQEACGDWADSGTSESDTLGNLKITNHESRDDDPKEAFLGYMNHWITNLDTNNKPRRSSQQIIGTSKAASSTRLSSFFNPASTSITAYSSAFHPPASRLPTPFGANAEDEHPAVLLDDDDTVEYEAAHSLSDLHALGSKITQSRDESIDYDQPPYTQKPVPTPVKAEPPVVPLDAAFDVLDDDPIIIDPPVATATPASRKRATTIEAANHGGAPPSKRSRAKPSSTEGVECSTRKVKYNNTHLPRGATSDNKWRGILIPTYAKWNGMLSTCWGAKSSSEVEVLQLLWNVVYKNKIPATVQSDDPIHTVATQRMAEWRGGFASASIAMVYSLINSNEAFNSPEEQCQLANFWLEGNRFLFEDVTGKTAKDYKGMWKSRFILQTFAAHMHFTQGAIDIPIETGLKDKHKYPKAALSLAGVAVKRTFVLLRDKALTFEIVPPTGKGKKKATGNEKWKANISGEMFKKDVWGHETARYMQSVDKIPPKVWDDIIKASLQLAKETIRRPGRGSSSDNEDDHPKVPSDDDDDELNDLMTYR